MRPITATVLAAVLVTTFGSGRAQEDSKSPVAATPAANAFPGGELRVAGDTGNPQPFPLKHTDVHAEITGRVAQVRVSQVFQNPYNRPIEAIYVFPLPRLAAVDEMEIQIGDRTIHGEIKRREEARALYDQARSSGRTAALLDQERPNIFTQSVANILPGEEIVVSLRYFDLLPYSSGSFEFVFPMVVGPRFIPGDPIGKAGSGWSPDTTDVPDASRITPFFAKPPGQVIGRTASGQASDTTDASKASNSTPPVPKPGERSGQDISLEIQLHAGMRLQALESPTHQVDIEQAATDQARIRLRQEDSIPNKDFVLRYRIDGAAPGLVLLPHKQEKQGHFLMLVQPEARPLPSHIAPKEMVFVADCSGSMSGFPIERVKEAMHYALENLNPLDNFQIVRFSYGAESFAPEPVPATPRYIEQAQAYVESLSGSGGTIMLEGVKTALSYPEDPQRLRIISFMTDGYIGNEAQILDYLSKNLGGARLFSFGVGSSTNRYLLDKMAEFGHGGVQYLLPGGNAEEAIKEFYERIRSPYLTALAVDWGELHVTDIFPPEIPDLFLGQPIALFGAYERAGAGEITLRGRLGGQPYEQKLRVELPERSEAGEAISTLWARSKIEDLSDRQIVSPQSEIVEEITQVALSHRLVSAYTSFVALEDRPRTTPDEPVQVPVPVPLPEGVENEAGVIGGVVGGVIGGVLGGVPGGVPGAAPLKQRIRVAGEILNTESAQASTTISSEFIFGLPVLGTDYQNVLTIAPGATDASPSGNQNVHGARDTGVVTTMDGAASSIENVGTALSMDSILEIEMVSSAAAASYGRAQGGFTNVIMSGKDSVKGLAIQGFGQIPVLCRLAALRTSYRADEPIEVYLVIKNLSEKSVKVPGALSVDGGTAHFRILDDAWKPVPQPASGSCLEKKRSLAPGEWIVFKLALNRAGGYRLNRPGLYHLVFLGSEFGLPDSTQLTLRIEP